MTTRGENIGDAAAVMRTLEAVHSARRREWSAEARLEDALTSESRGDATGAPVAAIIREATKIGTDATDIDRLHIAQRFAGIANSTDDEKVRAVLAAVSCTTTTYSLTPVGTPGRLESFDGPTRAPTTEEIAQVRARVDLVAEETYEECVARGDDAGTTVAAVLEIWHKVERLTVRAIDRAEPEPEPEPDDIDATADDIARYRSRVEEWGDLEPSTERASARVDRIMREIATEREIVTVGYVRETRRDVGAHLPARAEVWIRHRESGSEYARLILGRYADAYRHASGNTRQAWSDQVAENVPTPTVSPREENAATKVRAALIDACERERAAGIVSDWIATWSPCQCADLCDHEPWKLRTAREVGFLASVSEPTARKVLRSMARAALSQGPRHVGRERGVILGGSIGAGPSPDWSDCAVSAWHAPTAVRSAPPVSRRAARFLDRDPRLPVPTVPYVRYGPRAYASITPRDAWLLARLASRIGGDHLV